MSRDPRPPMTCMMEGSADPSWPTMQWLREYAVDAGWADILVRALADIASGHKHPQERATRALHEAGLGPPSPLQFWEGGETR